MTQSDSLNDRLAKWAQTHPTTISDEHRQIRDAFVAKFPLEHLRELTLEQYAVGRGDTQNFCYWLEWKTDMLGSIRGGTSKRFGVYWSQKKTAYVVNAMFSSPEDARNRILEAITQGAEHLRVDDVAGADQATAQMGDNRYTVRLKPLALYFPDKLLAISNPDDLKTVLRHFGQEPAGDQLALNVQLLNYLRQQPAAAAYDTLGLTRFLHDQYIRPPHLERGIWKVAPGADAAYLDLALKSGAIFIGSKAKDLGVIPEEDMAATLAGLDDPQLASSASSFAHTMQEGDVVIANRGRSKVVAVGLIEGPYQSPDAEFNPLPVEATHGELSDWRHARRVRWVLDQPVNLPAGLPMLAVKTVSTVQKNTLQSILTAYHAQDGSPGMTDKLIELGWEGSLTKPLPDDVRYLIDLAGYTRNIVLYGPPGTGKTRLAREFASAWLKGEAVDQTSTDGARPATWWQAIVLALAELKQAKVNQILAHPAVQALAAERKNNSSVVNTLWQQLLSHTRPDDVSGKATRRVNPYVFTRSSGEDENTSQWRLTDLGEAEAQKLAGGSAPGLPVTAAHHAVQHVTFHPAFTYEDFIEGLRPDGQGGFSVRDGVFKRMCTLAHQHPDQDFVLIIDEINRADTAKTFGELITLLEDDKRTRPGSHGDYPVTLPYSDAPDNLFSVPDNVYLIGTMNTADRSITLMDVALRRRFTFVEVPPQPALVKGNEEGLSLEKLLTRLNERLTTDLDADHRIGHAYLMGEGIGTRGVVFRWRHKVVPLLQEYYYGRETAFRDLLGETLYRDAIQPLGLTDNALMQALKQWTETA